MLTTRVLPPQEWHKIVDAGIEPFATHGLPDPAHWRFVVAEDEGQLVGLDGLYETIHNDPWWVHPAYRGHPTMLRKLWTETREVLHQFGVGVVHVTIGDPQVQEIAERFGFQPTPGKLYWMATDGCLVTKE